MRSIRCIFRVIGFMTVLLFGFKACAALQFDGISGNASATLPIFNVVPDGIGPITIALWVNSLRTNYSSITSSLTQKGSTGNNSERLFELRINGTQTNRLEFVYKDIGANFHIFAGAPNFVGQTNQWRHIVFTFTYGTGSSATMWIDGAIATDFGWALGSGNVAVQTNVEELTFGGGISGPWFGAINEFCIWTNILNEGEIQRLYHSRTKLGPTYIRPSAQICYYQCNNGRDAGEIMDQTNFVIDSSMRRAHLRIGTTTRGIAEKVSSSPPNE